MEIHVDRGGQRYGPYSIEDINRYLADGTLLPSDIGWHSGAAGWVPLTQIAGVKVKGAAPGPPAPTAVAGASVMKGASKGHTSRIEALEASLNKGGSKKGLKIALGVVGGLAVIAGIVFGVLHFLKKEGDGGGDNNGISKATAAWETMPDGVSIVGEADVVMQIKVGEIFESPLVQQQLATAPDAGEFINFMQQLIGIGPEDLQDLTISLSGISAVAQSASKTADPDFEAAIKSGKVKIGIVLRTSKPIDKAKIEGLLTQGEDKPDFEEKTQGDIKYYLFKADKPDEPDVAAYLADEKTLIGGLETEVQSHIDAAGKISARSSLEFLDTKQQITIAYLPPDNKAIETGVTKILAEMKVPPDAPPLQKDITQTAKTTLESLKKVGAAALSGGVTQTGLQLVASANFLDADSAKGFADNFNKLLKDARQIPDVAQFFLMAQGIIGPEGIPSAKSKEKQASLTLTIPMDSLGGMIGELTGGGSARHSQPTLKRWRILSRWVNNNQWPHATVIQKTLGKANLEKKNITMDVRTALSGGQVFPALRNTPQVPGCIRWDYFDDARGQRAIHLYFKPQTGQLIGVHWFESGPQFIGVPRVSGGNDRPNGSRPTVPREPGRNTKGSFRPKGSRPKGAQPRGPGAQRGSLQNTTGQAVSNSPPQSAAEAQQRLKGTWTSSSGGGVTLIFGDNNRFSTDAGSGPKRGNYRILAVSGNNIQFTGLHAANIATITLNGPGEFTVRQTSMLGVIPKGTFKRK